VLATRQPLARDAAKRPDRCSRVPRIDKPCYFHVEIHGMFAESIMISALTPTRPPPARSDCRSRIPGGPQSLRRVLGSNITPPVRVAMKHPRSAPPERARAALCVLLAVRSIIDQQRTATATSSVRCCAASPSACSQAVDRHPSPRRGGLVPRPRRVARRSGHRSSRSPPARRHRAGTDRAARRDQPLPAAPAHRTTCSWPAGHPRAWPVTAAIIVCAYSHRGRVRSEAAFAALGGIAPLPPPRATPPRESVELGITPKAWLPPRAPSRRFGCLRAS